MEMQQLRAEEHFCCNFR